MSTNTNIKNQFLSELGSDVTSVFRNQGLDVLRGLCAVMIMLYHYTSWTLGHFSAQDFMGRVGVYGVSLFYVLSGLTLFLVYYEKFNFSKRFLIEFFGKRFFRIFPLIWFVMILNYILKGLPENWIDEIEVATGLFSVLDWDAPTLLGLWSIGNELCFYLLVPLIFWCFSGGQVSRILVTLIVFTLHTYYAFLIRNKVDTNGFYHIYKNPLNQVGLFYGGMLIGVLFKNKDLSRFTSLFLFCTGLLILIFWPANGNQQKVCGGIERLVFSFSCFLMVLGVFKMDTRLLPRMLMQILIWLGEISYSLYLLHGICWSLILLTELKIRFVFPLAISLTLIISHIVYNYFENPIRVLGYKIIKRESQK